MILDISSSMKSDYKLKILRETMIMVIDTTTFADWIGVVAFNTVAKNYEPTLVKATSENKAKIKAFINNLNPANETDYEIAFEATFEMIKTSEKLEKVNFCKTIFLMMTDGASRDVLENKTNLINLFFKLDTENKVNATMFAFTIGPEVPKDIPFELACQTHGIFQNILDSQSIYNSLVPYFTYIAAGLNRTSVIWTEPYEDDIGLIISAAYPIYDKNSSPPFLMGVIGTDILAKNFLEFDNFENIYNELLERSQLCFSQSLNECQLQSIRNNYKCNLTDLNGSNNSNVSNDSSGSNGFNCLELQKTAPLCNSFNKSPFFQESIHPRTTGFNACCDCGDGGDGDTNLIIGLTVGLGGGLGFLIVLYLCYRWRKSKEGKKIIKPPKPKEAKMLDDNVVQNREINLQPLNINEINLNTN